MSLFTPNTGDAKMDKAYQNLQEHVSRCKTFEEFLQHFNYIVKTDDKEVLNRWLLKVLFVNMKQDPNEKHDFDRLLGLTNENERQKLTQWLNNELEKRGA